MRPAPGPVHDFEVVVNGYTTVLRLSERDAARYPDARRLDQPEPAPKPARTKIRTARNKTGAL